MAASPSSRIGANEADGSGASCSSFQTMEMAKSLHVQKLEKMLDIQPFLTYVEKLFNSSASDLETSSSDSELPLLNESGSRKGQVNGVATSKEERHSDKARLYNFSHMKKGRRWLKSILMSETSDSSENEGDEITEQELREMLTMHQLQKKYRALYYSNPENYQYQYYSAGLLSQHDKYPEHQKSVVGFKKKKMDKKLKKRKKGGREKYLNGELLGIKNEDDDFSFQCKEESGDDGNLWDLPPRPQPSRGRRKAAQQSKNPEAMAARRRKLWVLMAKKEVGKVQRAKTANHKEILSTCKRMATACVRFWRQRALQSQRNMKETVWRAKRLTREMQAYWKHYDRVERETRRRLEKEEEEQRKLDLELMEAKRQQRKLNFLITQTELYAHFMSRKLGSIEREESDILGQLEEERISRLAAIDTYDSQAAKERAKRNAQEAFNAHQAKTKQFDKEVVGELSITNPSIGAEIEQPQPDMFMGSLKHYQLKGMNWLANLYNQGINGILADEMGLGKTVQSIAFLAHVAEKNGVWGPFLVIAPASTLHNWQQEVQRFVPEFKVIPYWGNPQDRRVLRQFWNQRNLHLKEASFHVVITSYNLVVTDFKYFNRIKWQYMILDEAQAIKSTSSVRWKMLLGFSCRNRLLLSGTPIQNSMAELWALLHFIMPTLFDSHEEFNEWFSKDIESHAENKTGIDEKHLSRLHMILKPFMLRRIKKDVENELSDKIEIKVYCPLTIRQRLLYLGLKKKIRIEDLLHSSAGPGQQSQSVTSSLMNLVMQFRKVCNHPELFERREARSPFAIPPQIFLLPKFLFQEGVLEKAFPSQQHLLYNWFFIFNPLHVHQSIFSSNHRESSIRTESSFSFTRFIGLSPAELNSLTLSLLARWLHIVLMLRICFIRHHWFRWRDHSDEDNSPPSPYLDRLSLDLCCQSPICPPNIQFTPALCDLAFTSVIGSTVYTHTTHTLHSIPETVEHRLIRTHKVKEQETSLDGVSEIKMGGQQTTAKLVKVSTGILKASVTMKGVIEPEVSMELVPEFPHVPRPPQILECEPTDLPGFLMFVSPKVQTRSRELFCSDSSAAWWVLQHHMCSGPEGWRCVWFGSTSATETHRIQDFYSMSEPLGGLAAARPRQGWSNITIPDKQTLVTDAGKLYVLDGLLRRLKEEGHRVLIYSQMTRMIDLLEEYMWHRKHTYMRLDGSSKISDRRDMVADFQTRSDIFVFLLSTRAGGLGINLTAADTVIFYDSDWNPTVDQQAMDRAHRLGQTKQVTVYRLICKGTIEERILQRAQEKSEIQRMVISGGHLKPDALKPKEVVSLLLDDEEIEKKYRQRQEERKQHEEYRADVYRERDRERKRKQQLSLRRNDVQGVAKRSKGEEVGSSHDGESVSIDSMPASPSQSEISLGSTALHPDDTSNDGSLVVDLDTSGPGTPRSSSPGLSLMTDIIPSRPKPRRGTGRRGRPRGSGKRGIRSGLGRGELCPEATHAAMSPLIHSPGAEMSHSPPVKRGPGRPRLRPVGPGNQGTRAPPRLLVPLGTGPLQARLPRPPAPAPTGQPPNRPFGFYTPNNAPQ